MSGVGQERLLEQVSRVLLDKKQETRLVLAALLARGHVLLEDLPGVGKTTLALALANSLGMDFGRIQMTSDTLPGDLLGGNFYDPTQRAFVFRPGPIFHQVILVDEINRAPPRSQSALMEAMAEKQVSIEGTTHVLPEPFFVIATQNPMEYSGVYPLPENQLDRFAISISLGYPSRMAEERLLLGERLNLGQMKPVVAAEELAAWQGEASRVFLGPEIRAMLLDIAERTRRDPELRTGLSPRGLLALRGVAQAWACLEGRDFVQPEDLGRVTVPVLGHRLADRENGEGGRYRVARLMQECWGFVP